MAEIGGLEGPIIIALVSVIGIITALSFNIKSLKENTDAQFTSTLNDLIRDHNTLLLREPQLNKYDCPMQLTCYFDLMNRIAFLGLTEKKFKLSVYFKGHFERVLLMQIWADCVLWNDEDYANKRWPAIKKWCDTENIFPHHTRRFLPKIMTVLEEEKIKKGNTKFTECILKLQKKYDLQKTKDRNHSAEVI